MESADGQATSPLDQAASYGRAIVCTLASYDSNSLVLVESGPLVTTGNCRFLYFVGNRVCFTVKSASKGLEARRRTSDCFSGPARVVGKQLLAGPDTRSPIG